MKKNKKWYRQGKQDAFYGLVDNRSNYIGKKRSNYVKGYLKGIIKLLKEKNDELNLLFDLRWKADMKAIKNWQKKTGRDMVWPDHADLCVWLMDELDEMDDKMDKMKELKIGTKIDITNKETKGN